MIDIHEAHKQRAEKLRDKPKRGFWKLYREPLRKHIARHGVKQSDLNYGGVR